MNPQKIAEQIQHVSNDNIMRDWARDIGKLLSRENGVENGIKFIDELLRIRQNYA